jgi:hypothetical protein
MVDWDGNSDRPPGLEAGQLTQGGLPHGTLRRLYYCQVRNLMADIATGENPASARLIDIMVPRIG